MFSNHLDSSFSYSFINPEDLNRYCGPRGKETSNPLEKSAAHHKVESPTGETEPKKTDVPLDEALDEGDVSAKTLENSANSVNSANSEMNVNSENSANSEEKMEEKGTGKIFRTARRQPVWFPVGIPYQVKKSQTDRSQKGSQDLPSVSKSHRFSPYPPKRQRELFSCEQGEKATEESSLIEESLKIIKTSMFLFSELYKNCDSVYREGEKIEGDLKVYHKEKIDVFLKELEKLKVLGQILPNIEASAKEVLAAETADYVMREIDAKKAKNDLGKNVEKKSHFF